MRRRRVGYGLAGVVLCLGGVLAASGADGPAGGYAAVGDGGHGPEGAVPPSGDVVLVPLDEGSPAGSSRAAPGPGGGLAGRADTRAGAPGTGTAPDAPGDLTAPGVPGGQPAGGGADTGPGPGSPGAGSTPPAPSRPAPPPPEPSPSPPGPAVLAVAEVQRAPADERWCENVTVEFRNTGGSAVRSGTVVFGTHIIGALGVDWATIDSTQPLPAPIAAGAARTTTYRVCVDAWRVPLGMRVETRDVRAEHPS
ncbi:hypothetical protein [Streptomyces sp. NPDC007883]|uniref:hypothetical protein n=1 Tax=Streptomyces sp. NPDC007883 TaxID=3155116 RepID=UPI0033FB773F